MGTNKRYARQLDEQSATRTAEVAARPPTRSSVVPDWTPPWPPIQIGEAEWVIMRDSKTQPAAVIRSLRMGPRNETFYRVVTWAPTSDGRQLVGYFETLAIADRSVLFTPPQPSMPDPRTSSSHAMPAGSRSS